MYFQYPVPFATKTIGIAHGCGIARVDTHQILLARDLCVGKLADQMPRDDAAKNPSSFLGRLFGKGIEFSPRNVGRCTVVGLDSFKNDGQIGDQRSARMISQDVGSS